MKKIKLSPLFSLECAILPSMDPLSLEEILGSVVIIIEKIGRFSPFYFVRNGNDTSIKVYSNHIQISDRLRDLMHSIMIDLYNDVVADQYKLEGLEKIATRCYSKNVSIDFSLWQKLLSKIHIRIESFVLQKSRHSLIRMRGCECVPLGERDHYPMEDCIICGGNFREGYEDAAEATVSIDGLISFKASLSWGNKGDFLSNSIHMYINTSHPEEIHVSQEACEFIYQSMLAQFFAIEWDWEYIVGEDPTE